MNNSIQMAKATIQCSTRVTYPQGAIKGLSPLVGYARLSADKIALFLQETPFHPVDSRWPDQPADRGSLTLDKKKLEVVDCRIFAVKGDEVKENKEVPAKELGWHRVVGHIITDDTEDFDKYFNTEVEVDVDPEFRNNISLHHTGCHLAALALNIAVKDLWKKEVRAQDRDSLGHGNFDKLAIKSSFIFEGRTEDLYRIGNTMKKSFNREDMVKTLSQIQEVVNQLLSTWIKTDATVSITPENGSAVSDQRMWHCNLPEVGNATLPCGGTHVSNLSEFKSIEYALTMQGDEILATTKAVRSS